MKNIFKKKRLTALFLSVVMLVTLLPSLAFAWTNDWESTGVGGMYPQYAHPKVMFNASHIPTIQANLTAPENATAYTEFQRLIAKSEKETTISSLYNSYYDQELENMIEALAFDYAINGNETNGNYAIARLKEYLSIATSKSSSSDGLAYRRHGAALFHAAEVLDWCYPIITKSDATTIMGYCDKLIKKLEIYTKGSGSGHIDGQSGIHGHGAEDQLLRNILAYSIAIYNETSGAKFNDHSLYNAAMSRIRAEYIPVRNAVYQSGATHQGSEYGFYRFYWDMYAEILVERMRQYSPIEQLFDKEAMSQVMYSMIYARRPDGRLFNEGDNSHSNYWYYNNFNYQAAKLAGHLFSDPFFKGEYKRMKSGDDFKNCDYMSDNAVQWLILNDPSVSAIQSNDDLRASGIAKGRYFGSPIGKIYARTGWGFSKTPNGTGRTAVEMKIGEQYSSNHDHADAGTFQIYKGGLLTGEYGDQTDYGDDYDVNYYKRTVAHNAITIYDSSESFAFGTDFAGMTIRNDGGQKLAGGPGSFAAWQTTPYRRTTVVNHAIEEDSYYYIKGDITNAYNSSKASSVVRSMVFLPQWTHTMIVFDKVVSKKNSQIKKFLLHTASEPTVTNNNKITYDNTQTLEYTNGSVTNSGRLVVNTLLPASATIDKVSGTTVKYGTGSTRSYTGQTASKYEPEWGHVEIRAASEGTTTYFLNVLTAADTDTSVTDATIIGDQNSTLVGTRIHGNRVVLFANKGAGSLSTSETATFTVSGSDTGLSYYVFGLGEGSWTVINNSTGDRVGIYDATAEGGAISFKADAGTYTLREYDPTDLSSDVVAWYDYRKTDGSSSNSSVSTWYDMSGRGNHMDVSASNAVWYTQSGTFKGLQVTGDGGTNVTSLPQAAVDAINSGTFTIEFLVNMNTPKANLVSIFGNPSGGFAVYKTMAANKVYVKTPNTPSFINRPHWWMWGEDSPNSYGINNQHCIITVDADADEVKLYLRGKLVSESTYDEATSDSIINLVTEAGQSVLYRQIKVLNVAINAAQAKGEYNAYNDGSF